eukprot:Opistho-1_new@106834
MGHRQRVGLVAVRLALLLLVAAEISHGAQVSVTSATFATALASASSGDELWLSDGVYAGSVTLTTSVSLIGNGTSVMFTCGGGGSSVGLAVNAPLVYLGSFTTYNCGIGMTLTGGTIVLSHVVFVGNNQAVFFPETGPYINATFVDCAFSNNTRFTVGGRNQLVLFNDKPMDVAFVRTLFYDNRDYVHILSPASGQARVRLINCQIQNHYSPTNRFMSSLLGPNVTVDSSIFVNNTFLRIFSFFTPTTSQGKFFVMRKSVFIDNSVSLLAIFAQEHKASVADTFFKGTRSADSFVLGCQSTKILDICASVTRCRFQENVVNTIVNAISFSQLALRDSVFDNNTVSSAAVLGSSTDSALTYVSVNNCSFISTGGSGSVITSGGIMPVMVSNVVITGSRVQSSIFGTSTNSSMFVSNTRVQGSRYYNQLFSVAGTGTTTTPIQMFDNCTFADNLGRSASGELQGSLGAVSRNGLSLLKNTTFIGNEGLKGITVDDTAHVVVQDCTISGNIATGNTAVFELNGAASATVKNLMATGNIITSWNGAVFSAKQTATLDVTDSYFKDNRANSGGVAFGWGSAVMKFTRSTFESNAAVLNDDGLEGFGGAVRFIDSSTLIVSNCTFKANVGNAGGGAISSTGPVTVSVSDTVLKYNNATGVNAKYGGALHFDIPSQVSVVRCLFRHNQAQYGGGALALFSPVDAGPTAVVNCTFLQNRAFEGAALFTRPALSSSQLVGPMYSALI